jgi:hypothetical protein
LICKPKPWEISLKIVPMNKITEAVLALILIAAIAAAK